MTNRYYMTNEYYYINPIIDGYRIYNYTDLIQFHNQPTSTPTYTFEFNQIDNRDRDININSKLFREIECNFDKYNICPISHIEINNDTMVSQLFYKRIY
jgi:hypothetical protein